MGNSFKRNEFKSGPGTTVPGFPLPTNKSVTAVFELVEKERVCRGTEHIY